MKLEEIYIKLRDAGIENYKLEAKIMCENISPDVLTGKEASQELIEALNKRIEGYPLQYIIGKWWFWDCEFEVNENCLIPRPDTEILVEQAVRRIKRNGSFIDLCTGSGCIAISILHTRKDLISKAVDLFPQTLNLAVLNAKKNNVDDRFFGICKDVLNPKDKIEGIYDAILSNPPYIRTSVIDTLSKEVLHEPRAALDGGIDGLDFYKAIIDIYIDSLTEDGFFAFEIGYDQGDDLIKLAKENKFACEIIKDYGGCDRVAILKKQ